MQVKTKDFIRECADNALAVAILTKDGDLITLFGGNVSMASGALSGAILLNAIAEIEKGEKT